MSSANPVNLVSLKKNHLINKRYDKLKLLGTGDVKFKLQIEVNAISKSAKMKIEKNGGVVNILNHKKK